MTYETYGAVRDELVDQLQPHHAGATVPACPEWTVKDVIAHLSGLVAEKLAGVAGSLGSDEATTRQVGDRKDGSLGDVLAEWTSNMDAFGTLAADQPDFAAALTADLVIHVFDLDEILDLTTDMAASATSSSAHRYVPRLQQRAVDRIGLAVNVELADGTNWPAPRDESEPTRDEITLRATPHDFLRSVTGRRTRSQVEALDWSTDPTHLLDEAWNQYGPFRE